MHKAPDEYERATEEYTNQTGVYTTRTQHNTMGILRIIYVIYCLRPRHVDFYYSCSLCQLIPPRHNDRHFADDIFKCIFENENFHWRIYAALEGELSHPTVIEFENRDGWWRSMSNRLRLLSTFHNIFPCIRLWSFMKRPKIIHFELSPSAPMGIVIVSGVRSSVRRASVIKNFTYQPEIS